MLADKIIEKGALILRNLNINALNVNNSWSGALTGYNFYDIRYEVPLTLGHKYYYRCKYKFTTTNQSPTWVQIYDQDGMHNISGGYQGNPVAGTEYTLSGYSTPNIATPSYTITYGTIYNGNNGAISGVSSYVKEMLVYDVTDLFTYLKAYNIATTDAAAKTWCDTNLAWQPRYTNYDVTSLVTDASKKIFITKGNIISDNFIECDGMQYYSIANRLKDTYFDNSTGVYVYNNNGNGTVTFERVGAKAQGSPFYPKHPYVLKITTNGSASPYAGGFYTDHVAAANKIFVEKFVAKIPTGYNVTCHYNSQGSGASVSFISSTAGTGNWEEYTVLYKCGSSGSFSTGGHIALNGSNNTSVTWYVAYVNDCDITGKEYLKYYTALPNKHTFKDGNTYATDFDTVNIFPNGDGSDSNMPLPSGWSWDADDVAGNAKRSFVQPVGASAGVFNIVMPIDPAARYKISYWVKCKQDMTYFLTAIMYNTAADGTGTNLNHTNCQYVSGTKTKLAQALNQGATVAYLNSVNNWVVKNYSRLGFRNNEYTSCYNDKYTWNDGSGSAGVVTAVDTNAKTITLRSAYNGTAMPAGTVIVESFDGGTYPYPIGKGSLPTDNNWKLVTGYFGIANGLSDGAGSDWSGGIPSGVRSMRLQLNLYSNNGTVPIKYSDIRIEQVSISSGNRYDKKILLKEYK